MGFVWAIRRSLRLLTVLTLMASALCTGQILAAQEIAAPSATFAEDDPGPRGVLVDSAGSFAAQPSPVLVAAGTFQGESAVTIASAISTADAALGPAISSTATPDLAPAAAPLIDHFSPRAERAPPAA